MHCAWSCVRPLGTPLQLSTPRAQEPRRPGLLVPPPPQTPCIQAWLGLQPLRLCPDRPRGGGGGWDANPPGFPFPEQEPGPDLNVAFPSWRLLTFNGRLVSGEKAWVCMGGDKARARAAMTKSHRPGGSEPFAPCSRSPTPKCRRVLPAPSASRALQASWAVVPGPQPLPSSFRGLSCVSLSKCPSFHGDTGCWIGAYSTHCDLVLTNDTCIDLIVQLSPIPRFGGHSSTPEYRWRWGQGWGWDRDPRGCCLGTALPPACPGPVMPSAR